MSTNLPPQVLTNYVGDYSEYVQNLKDRGTYRLVKQSLLTETGTSSYDPGQLWSFELKNSYTRFRALNIPTCTQVTAELATNQRLQYNNNILTAAYEGNNTITNILPK